MEAQTSKSNELVLTSPGSARRSHTRIDNSILNTELKEAYEEAFEKHGYELINILRALC